MLYTIKDGPHRIIVVNKDGLPMGPVFNFDISGSWFLTWDGGSGISEHYLEFLYKEMKKLNEEVFKDYEE